MGYWRTTTRCIDDETFTITIEMKRGEEYTSFLKSTYKKQNKSKPYGIFIEPKVILSGVAFEGDWQEPAQILLNWSARQFVIQQEGAGR